MGERKSRGHCKNTLWHYDAHKSRIFFASGATDDVSRIIVQCSSMSHMTALHTYEASNAIERVGRVRGLTFPHPESDIIQRHRRFVMLMYRYVKEVEDRLCDPVL